MRTGGLISILLAVTFSIVVGNLSNAAHVTTTKQRSLVEPEESSRRRPTLRPTFRPTKRSKTQPFAPTPPAVVADPVYDPAPGVDPGNTPGVDPGKTPGEDPGFTPGYVESIPESSSDAPAPPADEPVPPADPVAPEVPPVSTPDVPAVVPAADAEPSTEPTTAVETESKPASGGDVVLAGLAFLAIGAIAFYFLFERRKTGYTRLADNNNSYGKKGKKQASNSGGVEMTDPSTAPSTA